MTKRLKVFYAVLAIIAGIIYGPAIIERVFVSPVRSFYVGGSHCVCGHWNYFRIEGDYLVKRNLGHNMTEEMYRAEQESGTSYRLFDSNDVEVGGVILTANSMDFDFGALKFTHPRVLNRWTLWWEQVNASSEPEVRKPQIEYEEKIRNIK